MTLRTTILAAACCALLPVGVARSAAAVPRQSRPALSRGPSPLGAREVAALADMTALRDAEILAFLDAGYLFPLEALDDLVNSAVTFYFDDIMYGGGAQAISIYTGEFLPQRVDVRLPFHHWGGPYVTYQQGKISYDGAGYDPGTPVDPWGNPYYLFSPLGLIRPTLNTVTLELYGDAFDRWTLVSLGSDGVMSSDDILLPFEGSTFGPPNRVVISSLRPERVRPGQSVTVRGYHFGATQDTSRLELDGRPVTTIQSWTDRAITFTTPPNFAGGPVAVVRGPQTSNAFVLHVLTAARRWTLYR